MSSVKHWGEFENSSTSCQDDWSLSYSDLEELLFPNPPSPSPPPPLFQPSQEETPSFQILPPEICKSDDVVLYIIKLLHHQRQLITRAQTLALEMNATPPPFPEEPQVERKAAKYHYLNFLPPCETPFTVGAKKHQKLEIEGTTARLILRKAVATILAHVGFTDTTESVLRILTDVAHDFLIKLTGVLRVHTDSQLSTGNSPFHDVVEQTLHTMNLGGMIDLHKMYKERVLNLQVKVRNRTAQLHHQYQNLLVHANSTLVSQPQSIRRDNSVEGHEDLNQTQASSSSHSSTTIAYLPGETSTPSIKSNSSIEPESAVFSYSLHGQGAGEEDGTNSPCTSARTYTISTTVQR